MLGFKRFRNAAITILGIELMHRIRKGQFNLARLRLKDITAPAMLFFARGRNLHHSPFHTLDRPPGRWVHEIIGPMPMLQIVPKKLCGASLWLGGVRRPGRLDISAMAQMVGEYSVEFNTVYETRDPFTVE